MTKEEIYDSKINPLMAKIIRICQKNKIACIASFSLDEDLACTTVLLGEDSDPPDKFLEARDILFPPKRSPLMITTRDKDGNITRMDAIL